MIRIPSFGLLEIVIVAIALGLTLLVAVALFVALVAIGRRRTLRAAARDEQGSAVEARQRRQMWIALAILLVVLSLPLCALLGGPLALIPVRRVTAGQPESASIVVGQAGPGFAGGADLDGMEPIEDGARQPAYAMPTPTPVDVVLPTPQPAFTPVPLEEYRTPSDLRIVFVKEGKVWLWTSAERPARQLTAGGGVDGDVRISDDGQLVAFLRGGDLWLVPTGGGDERLLVEASRLDAAIHRFDWVPGTHQVAFNTKQSLAVGLVLNNDLHLVDADSFEHTALLGPGEGGEFTYSPRGSQVALVQPDRISLLGPDNWDRRGAVLTYKPLQTYSQAQHYPTPVWSADGSALLVGIPVARWVPGSAQEVEIWHIPADGNQPWLVRIVTTAPSLGSGSVAFSDDLVFAAYLQQRGAEGESLEQAEPWLELRRLGSEDVMASPQVSALYGWAPGSRHFAYLWGTDTPVLRIGQWSGRGYPGSVEAGKPVVGFDWLDAEHYLVTVGQRSSRQAGGGSFELILADISGSSTVLVNSTDFLYYDFSLGEGELRE